MSQLPGGKGAERGSAVPLGAWEAGRCPGHQTTGTNTAAGPRILVGCVGPWGRLGAPEESSQALNRGPQNYRGAKKQMITSSQISSVGAHSQRVWPTLRLRASEVSRLALIPACPF